MNSQMKKVQQQMEDSLPKCCHSVCDETNGGEDELTDDEGTRTTDGRFIT